MKIEKNRFANLTESVYYRKNKYLDLNDCYDIRNCSSTLDDSDKLCNEYFYIVDNNEVNLNALYHIRNEVIRTHEYLNGVIYI